MKRSAGVVIPWSLSLLENGGVLMHCSPLQCSLWAATQVIRECWTVVSSCRTAISNFMANTASECASHAL